MMREYSSFKRFGMYIILIAHLKYFSFSLILPSVITYKVYSYFKKRTMKSEKTFLNPDENELELKNCIILEVPILTLLF